MFSAIENSGLFCWTEWNRWKLFKYIRQLFTTYHFLIYIFVKTRKMEIEWKKGESSSEKQKDMQSSEITMCVCVCVLNRDWKLIHSIHVKSQFICERYGVVIANNLTNQLILLTVHPKWINSQPFISNWSAYVRCYRHLRCL